MDELQTRWSDDADSLVTPKAAVTALGDYLEQYVAPEMRGWCHEPAAGQRALTPVLKQFFDRVDLFDHLDATAPEHRYDYLAKEEGEYDWIICHPPPTKLIAFVDKMLKESKVGCAALAPLTFMEVAPELQSVVLFYDGLEMSGDTYAWFFWCSQIRLPAFVWN